ncbi:hypothetical protein WICMUC_005684 [Wickerhamomyces mucosus]|uniref:Uncharacterized protein n=1 Tax=Wickerhamomyces mucosus TaxID=1378264 RepID=A0A9P8P7D3_9ASCO|nr:hypothetical protein WICMUC_005684 [Wickerhamomyces mucosus]
MINIFKYSAVLLMVFVSMALCADLDYYKVLGISKSATDKEIKSAYRTQSKKFHPDKNPGDEAAHQKFIEVGEAYEILSDSSKKATYDKYGHEGLKNGGGGGQPGGGFGGFGGGFNPFGDFFGGGFGQQQQQRGKPRGHDTDVAIDITLKDFYLGVDFHFSVSMQNICDHCEGTGSADGKSHKCSDCGGSGIKIIKRQLAPGMFQQIQTTCDKCKGKGQTFKHHCKKCHGEAVVKEERSYDIYIEPGTQRNHIHVLNGESDHSPDYDAGNLRINIRESKTNNLGYRRRFNNLYRTQVLSLKEAITGGWSHEIEFFDSDTNITIKREKNQLVQNGEIEIIKGKGMPILDGAEEFGDLIIEYVIIYPGGVSDKEKFVRDEL